MAAQNQDWRAFLPELVAVTAFVLILVWNVGTFDIDPYTEFFYIEAAKEMAHAGRFAVPMLLGRDFLAQPPLWTWIVLASFKLLGVSLWTARLPAMILTLLCLGLTYKVGVQLFQNRMIAFLSMLILGTTWGFFHQAVLSTPDIAASCLMLFFVLTFMQWQPLAVRRHTGKEEMRMFSVWFGAMAGVMLLLKGTVGVLLMGVMVAFYLGITQSWYGLRTLSWWLLVSVMLAIPFPWWLYVSQTQGMPDFVWQYLLVVPFQQITGSGPWASLEGDWGFYLRRILVNALPYVLFLLAFLVDIPIRRKIDRVTRPWLRWMVGWYVTGLILFSLSQFQEPGVMVLFYPALALLAGYYLGRAMEMGETTPAYNAAVGVYVVLLMLLAVMLTVFIFQVLPIDYVEGFWHLPGDTLLTQVDLGITILELEDPIPLWKLWLLPLPFILIAGGVVLYFMYENRRVHMAGYALVLTVIAFLLYIKGMYMPILDRPVPQMAAGILNKRAGASDSLLFESLHPDLKRTLFYLKPALMDQVHILTDPGETDRALATTSGKGAVFGVIRERDFYELDYTRRQGLRIIYADWKWDLAHLRELWKLVQARRPDFQRMRSHLIVYQRESPGLVRIETAVSP